MIESTSFMLSMVIAIPIIFAVVILLVYKSSNRMKGELAVFSSALSLAFLLGFVPQILKGSMRAYTLIYMLPGISLELRADPLGLVFSTIAAMIWTLAAAYSVGYMEDEHAQTRYYSFLLLCLAWTLGIGLAANLFTFLVFYELFSLSTYPLIIHEETSEAFAAGKKYLIYILCGGTFVLFSIIYTYFLAGTMDLGSPGILSYEKGVLPLSILFTTYILGFGVKGAIMPLHGWVPDAHPIAPSPFSALLSGIMVAAGTFGIARVIYNVFGADLVQMLGLGLILGYVVCFTIIVSSLLAIRQDDLKRRLAYSTIGQMGYIILGLSLLTKEGLIGSLVHVVNHAFMKGTLFLCAGVIIKTLGIRNISKMQGIGKRLPLTMGAFTVASLGMIGTPPLAGFISKWYLLLGALPTRILFIVVLLIGSLLGAIYLLPIVYTAFFQKPKASANQGAISQGQVVSQEKLKLFPQGEPETSLPMLFAVVIGAFGVFILGLLAEVNYFPIRLIRIAADFLILKN